MDQTLPLLVAAVKHHAPTLEATISRRMLRATIARSSSATTGTVSIRFSFADDEDRQENSTKALLTAHDLLVSLGFVVRFKGSPAYLVISSYHGRPVPSEEPAPSIAKVIDIETARAARRAS